MPPRKLPQRPGERVEADLRRRLAAGEWGPDDQLPTMAQLAAHYQVGQGTIGRVLARLEADGLVRIIPRWGIWPAAR